MQNEDFLAVDFYIWRRVPLRCTQFLAPRVHRPMRPNRSAGSSAFRQAAAPTRLPVSWSRGCRGSLVKPVIIENRSGASTNIAVQAVVNSPPDGYTLLWHGLPSVVNASLFTNLPFDIQRDIDPAAGVVSYPMIMVAHPYVPAKSVAELIAHAKANPGKVTMASFGTGSASHLAGELFKFMAGIDLVHHPISAAAHL